MGSTDFTEDFVDPYLDAETGVLRNLVGATTTAELEEAEGDLAFARLVQLTDHVSQTSGDLAELRAIHRHLFQDIYPWAGELRTVDVRKNVEGAEPFLPVSMIERAAGYAADELAQDAMLQGMSRDRFVERLAYHYDQFNYVHPFREGNGRTQRVMWSRIAGEAGWELDWRPVAGATNDAACRAASERRDFGPLREMFDQIVTAPLVDQDADALEAARIARLGFPAPAADAVRTSPADASGTAPKIRGAALTRRGELERGGLER